MANVASDFIGRRRPDSPLSDSRIGDIYRRLMDAELDPNDSNAMGLWHFDEGSGSTAVDSARNNTGAISGAAWAAGRFGTALSLDGTDDYANVTDNNILDITENITIEAWIYPTTITGSNRSIASKHGAYQFVINSSGTLRCDFWLSSYSQYNGARAISLNAWQHVACVRTRSEVLIYVDGVLDRAYTSTGTISTNANHLYIGNNESLAFDFAGRIDELRISNISRVFNTTLTYDIVRANIAAVRVYNETGVQIDAQTGLS
jgi:hypothetical protein